jgi:glycosyltransferase involved in cell wall biosynthesis
MHDSVVGNPQDIWSIVRPSGLRAINFCRHTHAFFVGLGYESLCVQYWPQARVQSVGTTNGLQVFMWMRKKEIGWSVLKALLGTARPARILLRVAADPGESLELPSPEDIQEYNIEVITGWLEKTRYMELLTACDIFVAPRLNEGIGQSFLEAMSYGMAVIAPDSPTMNEYIRHGHNGYLYAPTAPQPLDFSKLGTIREQALRDVTAGHIAWQAQQSAVLKCLSSRARKGPGFRWRLDGFFGR